MLDDFEVISRYTRAQALEDGVLIDVTAMAKEASIKFPVAITSRLWHGYVVPSEQDAHGQSTNGRLWDLLYLFAISARRTHGPLLIYEVGFLVNGHNRIVNIKALIGPGDNWEPVITLMLTDED